MDVHASITHLPQHAYGHGAGMQHEVLRAMPGYVPVAPLVAEQLAETPHLRQAEQMRDPLVWTLVKHAALGSFVLMAVLIVLRGMGDLMMVGTYAGTAFLCIVMF